jgi:hypothetical protein
LTETVLQFYPLKFVVEPPDVIVGRIDNDSFAAFPEDGAELLKQLQQGLSLEAASTWYQEHYGEALDMADFLETLKDLQFIQSEPTEASSPTEVTGSTGRNTWQLIGRAFFSLPAWIIYIAFVAYTCYLWWHAPYLRVTPRSIFFSPYYTVIELGLLFGQIPGILFHEAFHVLAGKRLNINSRLGVGRRFILLVFETQLTGLWSVPRRQRYLPYLAGMLGDILWFSLLLNLANLTSAPGHPSLFGAFCLALAFATSLRFFWQFYFYLQTDIYYAISNATRCIDLQQTTRRYLLNRFSRLLGRTDTLQDEEEWHPNDRRFAPWYAPIYCLGYVFTFAVFLFAILPVTIQFLSAFLMRLFHGVGYQQNFWDTILFLGMNLAQLLLVLGIFLREVRKKTQQKRAGQAALLLKQEISTEIE